MSNKTQLYTVYFVCKLLYTFRVVSAPIIRSTNNCAPDDGWRNHLKPAEQFTDKINCVHLHLVGYLLTQNYDARSHEHKLTNWAQLTHSSGVLTLNQLDRFTLTEF